MSDHLRSLSPAEFAEVCVREVPDEVAGVLERLCREVPERYRDRDRPTAERVLRVCRGAAVDPELVMPFFGYAPSAEHAGRWEDLECPRGAARVPRTRVGWLGLATWRMLRTGVLPLRLMLLPVH